MARRKYWIGSSGPYFYNDDEAQGEEDLTLQKALKTEGAIEAQELKSEGDLYGNLQGFNEALKKSFLL